MVYIIQSNNEVKIGVAKNVKKRMQQIQTSNQHTLNLIGTKETDDDYFLETEIHHYLYDYRIRGEWFRLSENKMNSVIKKFKFDIIQPYILDDDDYNNLADAFDLKLKWQKLGYENKLERHLENNSKEIQKNLLRKVRERIVGIINEDIFFGEDVFIVKEDRLNNVLSRARMIDEMRYQWDMKDVII
jgi:hypothetical protein